MRHKIYTKTEQAWDAMLEAIKGAKSSVLLEMYIFADDTSDTHNFVDILVNKALSGVRVKIIFDSFGIEISQESLKKLKDAGVELLFYKALFRMTHRKMLIIDEKVAFVGGVNIKNYFKKWDDLFIRTEGRVVRYVLRSFARMYKDCGGMDALVLQYDKKFNSDTGKLKFYDNYPPGNSIRLRRYYKEKIAEAKENILLVTPYFMPNHWLRRALVRAAKRGVSIEIIMPRIATHPKISNIANYFYMAKLHKYGIKSFLTREMMHSKLMLIDGREGVLGSQNLDIVSFDLNAESGVYFTDLALVKELKNVAENWKKDAEIFSPKMRATNLFDYFLEFCFSLFELLVGFFNRLTSRKY